MVPCSCRSLQVHSSKHSTAALWAYSDHSAPTLPPTGVPSLFGDPAVVAVPATTSVPSTVICSMALIRSTGCTGIFCSSSVSLRMLEALAHFLKISPFEWPPPYLALGVVHVGQSCVPGTCTTSSARNVHVFLLSHNPASSSLRFCRPRQDDVAATHYTNVY